MDRFSTKNNHFFLVLVVKLNCNYSRKSNARKSTSFERVEGEGRAEGTGASQSRCATCYFLLASSFLGVIFRRSFLSLSYGFTAIATYLILPLWDISMQKYIGEWNVSAKKYSCYVPAMFPDEFECLTALINPVNCVYVYQSKLSAIFSFPLTHSYALVHTPKMQCIFLPVDLFLIEFGNDFVARNLNFIWISCVFLLFDVEQ